MRRKLPQPFETELKSEKLKSRIGELGLWFTIPAVRGDMDTPFGKKRLKEHMLLFRFLDTYFPNADYAFEPNMQDGRFVLIPEHAFHQGIGISISKTHPRHLEVAHFWYPGEYISKNKMIGIDQIYVCNFLLEPNPAFAEFVRKYVMTEKHRPVSSYCTFPFDPTHVLTLKGPFLDKKAATTATIREFLKDTEPAVQRNGQGLIEFIWRYE
ncbi:MAG: hypothetical protein IJT77_11015 [Clostridia bacterium]|nr:hypothetical protein [Clostridia bacterium]